MEHRDDLVDLSFQMLELYVVRPGAWHHKQRSREFLDNTHVDGVHEHSSVIRKRVKEMAFDFREHGFVHG
jgi:hypothetical protein